MEDPRIYPLTFQPALRDYLWGGRRLETLYGRALPPGVIAESWEISGHPTAPTRADAGVWTGQPLPVILAELGERLVGSAAAWALQRARFPLLVKLLDAQQDLSVQVHPGDAYALAHEAGELGKTEMWYVLHAEPGAGVILGVKPGVTREVFAGALQIANRKSQVANRKSPNAVERPLAELLRRVPVQAGQAIAIPAGTVHALLAGTVVTEIQQNSDATYRIYDWGRVGTDGKPRELHVEKALDVIDFAPLCPPILGREQPAGPPTPPALGAGGRIELVRNRYFVVEEVTLATGAAFDGAADGMTLEIWGCLEGQAQVEWAGATVALPAIRYTLLPATLGAFRIVAATPSKCLRVYLPAP
jgi:mannose-6-phosphate isomerase